MHRPDGCCVLNGVIRILKETFSGKLPPDIAVQIRHLQEDVIKSQEEGRKEERVVRVGDRFKRSASPGLPEGVYQIVGAVKGNPSGPCCMASLTYGWSYTGEMIRVGNCHNITANELLSMTSGHVFIRLGEHRKGG